MVYGMSTLYAAQAQSVTDAPPENVHPVIGVKPPKDLLASDILSLPERERQAWIHGAVSLTAQTASRYDPDLASCVLGWYFKANGADVINLALKTYPDTYATSVVFAAATNTCAKD